VVKDIKVPETKTLKSVG